MSPLTQKLCRKNLQSLCFISAQVSPLQPPLCVVTDFQQYIYCYWLKSSLRTRKQRRTRVILASEEVMVNMKECYVGEQWLSSVVLAVKRWAHDGKHLRGSCKPAWMVLGRHYRAGGHEQKHGNSKGVCPRAKLGEGTACAKPGMVWRLGASDTSALLGLNCKRRTSLAVQWLSLHLPVKQTRVPSLVWEGSTCHGAAKRAHYNCWARKLWSLSSATKEATIVRSLCTCNKE